MYHLHFFEPIDGKSDYYFSSLYGAFMKFRKEQIGFTIETLSHTAPSPGKPRISSKCAIYREILFRSAIN